MPRRPPSVAPPGAMATTSPAHGDGAQRVPLLEKDLDVGSGTTAPPRSRFVPAVATFLAALAVSAVLLLLYFWSRKGKAAAE